MSKIKETYKSKDTEEFLDKIFYRPIGYVLAITAKALRITPNQVTILSIFVGVAGGHLLYYNNLSLNIYGILLLMFAQALDGADGQLARMTNSQSQLGRILDGISDNLKFISIYVHLLARLIEGGAPVWIIGVAIVAGFSHSLQSAVADYSRNLYVYFVLDKKKSEIDDSAILMKKYERLSWKKDFGNKLFQRLYLNYTLQQESIARKMKQLYLLTKDVFGENIPDWLRNKYRELHKPLIKWYNILTSNTRLIVLFFGVLIGYPCIFWIFELTALNLLLVYVIIKHNNYSDYLIKMIMKGTDKN